MSLRSNALLAAVAAALSLHAGSANAQQPVGQRIGANRYFDAAGFPDRSVGMDERKAASR